MGDGEMPREYIAFETERHENGQMSDTHRLDLSWGDGNVVLTHRTFRNGTWTSEDGTEGCKFDNELMHTIGTGLDRKAINDLIRNLRKARDQAFGKDE